MLLRTAHNSPFGRKVILVAQALNLADRITLADCSFADPADPLRIENPLGKMPVLTTDDGMTLFDSAVIVEYLNDIGGGSVLPQAGQARWHELRQQALADGVMDAGVAIQMEKNLRPPEKQHADWIDYQQGKMLRGLGAFAQSCPSPTGSTIASLALACALDWIDFRKPVEWRNHYPLLATWLGTFVGAHPRFSQTAPR